VANGGATAKALDYSLKRWQALTRFIDDGRLPIDNNWIENQMRRPVESAQYTSKQFQDLLKEHGITCSMSRASEVWDNSAMESFFSSMKTERIARKVYRSRGLTRADVFDYIERFYNPRRRHSTLGYVSPIQFERAQEA
jgi:putative transposase